MYGKQLSVNTTGQRLHAVSGDHSGKDYDVVVLGYGAMLTSG
jgi:hypothetical protein